MMCTRCDHMHEKDRGTSYKAHQACITKGKEHLAVHCHGIRPDRGQYSEDAALRHGLLLVSFSEKHKKMSMSKKGQNMVVAAQKLDHQSAADSSASSRARLADNPDAGLDSAVHCNTYALHALSITLRI